MAVVVPLPVWLPLDQVNSALAVMLSEPVMVLAPDWVRVLGVEGAQVVETGYRPRW